MLEAVFVVYTAGICACVCLMDRKIGFEMCSLVAQCQDLKIIRYLRYAFIILTVGSFSWCEKCIFEEVSWK